MGEKAKGEYEFADTVFVRDIESRVFQAIAFKCLMGIEGVELMGGNILDSLLGRESPDRIKGISVDQDQKNHSVNIKIEVNISYGLSIPEKAEEIQAKVTQEICRLTGLHVGSVHVVFKGLISQETKLLPESAEQTGKVLEDSLEYSEELLE